MSRCIIGTQAQPRRESPIPTSGSRATRVGGAVCPVTTITIARTMACALARCPCKRRRLAQGLASAEHRLSRVCDKRTINKRTSVIAIHLSRSSIPRAAAHALCAALSCAHASVRMHPHALSPRCAQSVVCKDSLLNGMILADDCKTTMTRATNIAKECERMRGHASAGLRGGLQATRGLRSEIRNGRERATDARAR